MSDESTNLDLQALEEFVIENDDLLTLEETIGKFNVFDSLGIARVEIRHSNFLAWLITPSESHGLGDTFLKALLMDVLREARKQGFDPPVSPVELDGAELQGVDIRREWRNIDLLIACDDPKFVVAIENKVDSSEHSNQLQRYEDIVRNAFPGHRSLHVFLTPDGSEASDDDWVGYSYGDIHRVFTRTRRANAGAIGNDVGVFLDHYLSLIGNRFMDNETIDRLCRQIYTNHRRALDLIFERVGSPASELVSRIEQWLRERPSEWNVIAVKRREIEFVPKAWDKMLPPIGKRKSREREHWMTVRFFAREDKLCMHVLVCPTSDLARRKLLLDRLVADTAEFGFPKKKSFTDAWTRLLSEDICELTEDGETDLDAVLTRIEKHLSILMTRTQALPAAVAILFPR